MYQLVKYPSENLTQKSKPVTTFDDSLSYLVDEMFEAVRYHEGIGLAAPQIGENLRVIIVRLNEEPTLIESVFVNPKIISTSKTRNSQVEGCLSVPNVFGGVFRWNWITMEYEDIEGNSHQLKAQDLFARVLQHEIDHLDGVLFFSHNKQTLAEVQRLYVQ